MSAPDNSEESLTDQLGHLATCNRLKSEFIANVSHELRTPIHAIIGYVELLADGVYGDLSEEQLQTVEYVRDSATDLLGLVNNLLDLSRIESGRSDLIITTFDLRDLVAELFAQLQPLASAKHLALNSRMLADRTLVRTDRGKLKQILVNLVGNALKFTSRGYALVTVADEPARRPGPTEGAPPRLRIQIQDTGIGIPADKLGLIFDRFYQVDSSANRRHEGTGLGLYITKQLLELIAGTIELHSDAGQGTTVTLSLPINYDELQAVQRIRASLESAPRPAAPPASPSERLVLVVGANPDFGRILTDGLGAARYSVRVVASSSDTPALARDLHPLVILLNAEEASPSFWSVFQELKSQPSTKDIPVIFLGANPDHSLTAPLTLTAPLSRQEVLHRIRSATATSQKKVLVVDDDSSFREVLQCALAEDGYQVAEAANGRDAIEKLTADPPDLVLLDLRMPDIDGWGVIRHLTRQPPGKQVGVLVVTGDSLDERESTEIQAHTRGCILKANFNVHQVLDQVAQALEVD